MKGRFVAALVFVPLTLHAQTVTHLLDPTTLVATPDAAVVIDPSNACDNEATCRTRYVIEDRARVGAFIGVNSVAVNATTLTVTLKDSITSAKAMFLVISDFLVPNPPNPGTPKHLGRKDIGISARMTTSADEPNTIQYDALTKVTLPNDLSSHVAVGKAISLSDPDDFDRPYAVRVIAINNSGDFQHDIQLASLPKGKKLDVAISGIESLPGGPVAVKGALKTTGLPKSRDDAEVWIGGGIDTDNVKKERKYKLDTRLHHEWAMGRWHVGPTVDATIGNRTSKAPNTGSVSGDFRYFFGASNKSAPGLLTDHSVLIAPIFRADKTFDNRDLGIDVAWEPRFTAVEHSLEFERTRTRGLSQDPFARHWGFCLRPVIAVETGRHLKSVSPAVEHHDLSRARGELKMTLQYENFSITLAGVTRHLFTDEVLLDDSGGVLRIDRSDRGFLRGDLLWDFGVAGLTISHMNGRQPPAFTQTHTTTLGIALKW